MHEKFQGGLNWSPMMPRDDSLSDRAWSLLFFQSDDQGGWMKRRFNEKKMFDRTEVDQVPKNVNNFWDINFNILLSNGKVKNVFNTSLKNKSCMNELGKFKYRIAS